MRSGKGLLFPIVFIFFCIGCGTGKYSVKAPLHPSFSPEEFIKKVDERNRMVSSLRGMARFSLSGNEINATANEVVVARRPSSVRLETLGLFGTPVFIFASNGDNFSMTGEKGTSHGRVVSGRVPSLPFPFNLLSLEEVTTVFLGGIPLLDTASMNISEDGRSLVLEVRSSDGVRRQKIWYDRDLGGITRTEVADDGLGSTISIIYEKFSQIGAIPFPKNMVIELTPNPKRLAINYDDIELNVNIDDSLFEIVPN